MSVPIACPKCNVILERNSGETLPSHCPACGVRITCPRCGATLERHGDQRAVLHCGHCQTDLTEGETVPLGQSGQAAAEALLSLPGFELRGELGRGGMGIVYRAVQLSLRRKVAVKVLPPALAGDAAALERFRNEAAVAASLVDSHILPVFDIQEVQGVPVIVMPLVEGSDLGRILRDRMAVKRDKAPVQPHPWALLDDRAYLQRVLRLLDQIVAAGAAFHRGGVLHRDIKPSNVLVDDKGNPWLSDFGLARLEERGLGTRPGFGMGTAAYASPEQARGEEEIDFRADLFSLGATLYQALTLELPYGKAGAAQNAARPIAPSRRQPLLRRDFDAVLLKALDRDRNQRYGSAPELQEDWQRVRQGLLPRARPAGLARRLARAARRHPAASLAGLATAFLLLLAGAVLFPRGSTADRLVDVPAAAPGPGPYEPPGIPSRPIVTVFRTVQLETVPPGAQIVLVPIHPYTGAPLPNEAIRPNEKSPVAVEQVPVGEYLVIAAFADGRFHEVYRTVARPKQVAGSPYAHRFWRERGETVELPAIVIPAADVLDQMTLFEGGKFTMGMENMRRIPRHERQVAPFYLDATEVTVAAYRKIRKALPKKLTAKPPPDNYPVTYVSFDDALVYAETVGKRLPDEAEYEFAATRGGTTTFPWGEVAGKMPPWTFGPVREPAHDFTGKPPVYGLYSNVAEWTLSWYVPYPDSPPDLVAFFFPADNPARNRDIRVVRGGTSGVVFGEAGLQERGPDWVPCYRHGFTRDKKEPGLGFRCARSARPSYLDKAVPDRK